MAFADPPPAGWTDGDGKKAAIPWKPRIHMPRWASRILLEVVSVRVEKLGLISEARRLARCDTRVCICRHPY